MKNVVRNSISVHNALGGPDITQPTIPVPGPDLPHHSPSQPTMPQRPAPDTPFPGGPDSPSRENEPLRPGPGIPPLPGQPQSPTM